MKRIALLMIALGVLNLSKTEAQTQQGKIMVGVSSGLSLVGTGSSLMSFGFNTNKHTVSYNGYSSTTTEKSTSFNLFPKVGYFVIDNLAVGVDFTYVYNKTEMGSSNNTTWTTTIIGVGPFARFYLPSGKVLPFFEASGLLGFGDDKSTSNYSGSSSDSKLNIVGFFGGAGIAAPLGEKVTFDVLVGYNTATQKYKDSPNEKSVNNTIGLKLGFTVHLGK